MFNRNTWPGNEAYAFVFKLNKGGTLSTALPLWPDHKQQSRYQIMSAVNKNWPWLYTALTICIWTATMLFFGVFFMFSVLWASAPSIWNKIMDTNVSSLSSWHTLPKFQFFKNNGTVVYQTFLGHLCVVSMFIPEQKSSHVAQIWLKSRLMRWPYKWRR